jgi:predicted nucleic acid-binding protein
MVLLDTNIFIYLSKGTLGPAIISDTDIAHSSITKIEALGFTTIPANELLLLEAVFSESYDLSVTGAVVETAVKLRQRRRMSLGDSIIAATALENQLELWTANVDDFANIEELVIVNPLLGG